MSIAQEHLTRLAKLHREAANDNVAWDAAKRMERINALIKQLIADSDLVITLKKNSHE